MHQFRSSSLDILIKSLNFFDRQEFFFILIPIIWLCYRWQFGRRIFYLFLMSSLVNLGLKSLFAEPRPFMIDPSVGMIRVSGYSFPSGAAQSSILIAGLIIYYCKTRWKWPLALLYVAAISFSRVYLGVHFPIDILGGWCVGLILWFFYLFLFPQIEAVAKKLSPLAIFIISQVAFFTLISAFPSTQVIIIAATASGLECGVLLNFSFFAFISPPSSRLEFWIRAIVGPLGVFAIYTLSFALPLLTFKAGVFILFFLAGLWVSAGANGIFRLLARKMHH